MRKRKASESVGVMKGKEISRKEKGENEEYNKSVLTIG